MGYKFTTDVIFNDDVKVVGDLIVDHCIIGYPTRTEVKSLIASQGHLKRAIVSSLPTSNIDLDTIYMIKKQDIVPLTLNTWYGGVDDDGNWGTEVQGPIGQWVKCKVFQGTNYKISPDIIVPSSSVITEESFSGARTPISVENGTFTAPATGYLMLGLYDSVYYDNNIYDGQSWKITITSQLKDAYQEYMYIDNQWVMTGDTSVDLSNFVTVNEIGDINKALDEIASTLELWRVE